MQVKVVVDVNVLIRLQTMMTSHFTPQTAYYINALVSSFLPPLFSVIERFRISKLYASILFITFYETIPNKLIDHISFS